MAQSPEPITYIDNDTTLRWSCRAGDYLLWVRCKNFFSWPRNPAEVTDFTNYLSVRDIWELKDGDFVTITARVGDLPQWFTIHPTEVKGQACFPVMEKLQSGFEPGDPMETPHFWRALAGDRLVWVGAGRTDCNSADGVLAVAVFASDAAVYGDSTRTDFDPLTFGNLSERQPAERVRKVRRGLERVWTLGAPETFSADEQWRIG